MSDDAATQIQREKESERTFKLVRIGTWGSLGLVALCLAGAGLLCWKLIRSALGSEQDELMVRVLLSCVACFIGMGFACLGFGLFLIQAKGSFSTDVEGGDGSAKGKLATNAPGLVVVVCATIVIALALNLSWRRTTTSTEATPNAIAADPAADGVVMPDVKSPPAASSDGVVMPSVPDAQLPTKDANP